METIILVIHLMLALALIGLVLMQRSEGGALGIGGGGGGGGGMGGFLSARGSANLLTRATATVAALFIATSLALAILAGGRSAPSDRIGTGTTPGTSSTPKSGTPNNTAPKTGAPPAPAAPDKK